ncbi:MAG: bacteriophage holin [Verrucomicrobiota bacterium]|nr:bacteriophage holin [Verrucomicrobiota bacterium]
MKINVKAFALTCGILWGVGLFALTWWIIAFNGSTHTMTFIGLIYPGYHVTPLGSVLGLIYGFFDALIGGAIAAWLYNRIAACSEKKEELVSIFQILLNKDGLPKGSPPVSLRKRHE